MANPSAGLVGSNPTAQCAVKPGCVPEGVELSCLVAYGVLFAQESKRLLVAADWMPYWMVTTTDPAEIDGFLAESEIMTISAYIEKYGNDEHS